MTKEVIKKPGFSARRPTAAASNGLEKSLKDLQEPSKRLQVILPKSLHKKLSQYALDNDQDMSTLIRGWITEKLEIEEG